jgi:Ca2+-binding EF-hand superfamily protein
MCVPYTGTQHYFCGCPGGAGYLSARFGLGIDLYVFWQAFKAAGMDASERMGQKQFISVLRQHFDMGDKEATRHFDAFCAYKNSPTITYPEYCQACVAVTSASSADKIDLAFELYARLHSTLRPWTVSSSNALACAAVDRHGAAHTSAAAALRYDVDNNGFINFEEFSNLARNIIVGAVSPAFPTYTHTPPCKPRARCI